MKKRILIFSLAYDPFIGGAEVVIKEITNRIHAELDFDMITLRFDSALPRFEKIGNVNVYRIGFVSKNPTPEDMLHFPLYLNKIFYPVTAFLKARALDKRNRYDAMWTMMSFMGFPALFFQMFCRKIPYLLTLQEGDPIPVIKKRIRFVYPLFKRVFAHASKVQAISNYLAGFAKDMGATCPVVVVPNGVGVEKFEIRDLQKEGAIRNELKIKDGEKIIITTSRLVPKNAVGDIIEALTYLPQNVRLLILGVGPLLGELRKKSADVGVSDRVTFCGHILQEELPSYLHVADVFCRPSLSEGQGVSFIETMAAGVPIVATAVGGIPDFLHNGETGLFCEVKNPRSVAEKIQILLDDQLLHKKIVENAKVLAKSYDWALLSEKMSDLLIKL